MGTSNEKLIERIKIRMVKANGKKQGNTQIEEQEDEQSKFKREREKERKKK